MAFSFADIMSRLGTAADQRQAGQSALQNLPLAQKLMMGGQIIGGHSDPLDMLGAMQRLGQNHGGMGTAAAGQGAVPMNMLGQMPQMQQPDLMKLFGFGG